MSAFSDYNSENDSDYRPGYLTDSESDYGSNHSINSASNLSQASFGSRRSNNLPSYRTFFNSLPVVDRSTLPLGEECPVCTVPYPANYSNAPQSQDTTLLDALPLPQREELGTDVDIPVRLPCSGGHIIGVACMRIWVRNIYESTRQKYTNSSFTETPR
jgi:hypothetical protein